MCPEKSGEGENELEEKCKNEMNEMPENDSGKKLYAAKTGTSLTARQARFVSEYLVDLNATQAAIRAGYSPSGARAHACRLLMKEDVKAAVEKAMARRTQLCQDEVIEDLRELRDICMGRRSVKIMTIVKNAREGTAEPVEVEGMMFEPASANRALELLGKHMKMFTDKMDMTSNGQTLQSGVLLVPPVPSLSEWEKGVSSAD